MIRLHFQYIPCCLSRRSLPVRRWRRRRPELAYPRPSPGSRTLPGLPSPRSQTPGSGCLCPPPATQLLHRLGCGPDGAPPLPRPWSVYTSLLRCRLTPQDLQDVSQTFHRGPFPCPSTYGSCFWSKNDLFSPPPPPPPPRFQGFFRVPRPLLSNPHHLRHSLLRLHVNNDDQRTANTHPRDSPEPEQSPPVDGSQLSAEKVQKLFADLIDPPALSHYADPLPDSAPNTQLVPYVRTSSTAPTVNNSEPLETHGLFQNYQSFHRLSGDTEKEACTAAYHDLTNLMLSQTEEPSLINVSSSRPKTDDPFPCGLAVSNEMKKKQEKLHLQWPPQSDHNKVINRTLALYQHGPPPKSGTVDDAQTLGSSFLISPHAPTSTVHGSVRGPGLGDFKVSCLAGSLRSQVCSHLHHVRHFNGRGL